MMGFILYLNVINIVYFCCVVTVIVIINIVGNRHFHNNCKSNSQR